MNVQIRKSSLKEKDLKLIHNEDYNETIEEKFAEILKCAKEKGWSIYDLDVSFNRNKSNSNNTEYVHVNLTTLFNKNINKNK